MAYNNPFFYNRDNSVKSTYNYVDVSKYKPLYGSSVNYSSRLNTIQTIDNTLKILPSSENNLNIKFNLRFFLSDDELGDLLKTIEIAGGYKYLKFEDPSNIYRSMIGLVEDYTINKSSNNLNELSIILTSYFYAPLFNWRTASIINLYADTFLDEYRYSKYDVVYAENFSAGVSKVNDLIDGNFYNFFSDKSLLTERSSNYKNKNPQSFSIDYAVNSISLKRIINNVAYFLYYYNGYSGIVKIDVSKIYDSVPFAKTSLIESNNQQLKFNEKLITDYPAIIPFLPNLGSLANTKTFLSSSPLAISTNNGSLTPLYGNINDLDFVSKYIGLYQPTAQTLTIAYDNAGPTNPKFANNFPIIENSTTLISRNIQYTEQNGAIFNFEILEKNLIFLENTIGEDDKSLTNDINKLYFKSLTSNSSPTEFSIDKKFSLIRNKNYVPPDNEVNALFFDTTEQIYNLFNNQNKFYIYAWFRDSPIKIREFFAPTFKPEHILSSTIQNFNNFKQEQGLVSSARRIQWQLKIISILQSSSYIYAMIEYKYEALFQADIYDLTKFYVIQNTATNDSILIIRTIENLIGFDVSTDGTVCIYSRKQAWTFSQSANIIKYIYDEASMSDESISLTSSNKPKLEIGNLITASNVYGKLSEAGFSDINSVIFKTASQLYITDYHILKNASLSDGGVPVSNNKINNFWICKEDFVPGGDALTKFTKNFFFEAKLPFELKNKFDFYQLDYKNSFVQNVKHKENSNSLKQFVLKFDNITNKQAKAMLFFLEKKSGYRRFIYEFPIFLKEEKVFICVEWNHSMKFYDCNDLTLTLVEDPNPNVYISGSNYYLLD